VTIIPITSPEHWRELRSKHVGGSEIAALFDCCPYLTRLELWLSKRGEVSDEIPDTDRMFWGRTLEEGIAQGVSAMKGWVVENPHGYFTCDDTPGMGCTPDRVLPTLDGTGNGLLQIKNIDRLVFMGWEDGQPPLQYQLQLQHELACAGYSWGALAVLIGGNQLEVFRYDAHPGAIGKIKIAVREFWESVAFGKPPKAVGEDYDILRELYGQSFGPPVDLSADNESPALCSAALDAAERRKAAEKEEKSAKASILQKIGDAGRATCNGFSIKRTPVKKDGYVVKPQSYTLLTIKEDTSL
jgi:putative phage-type endonuclease